MTAGPETGKTLSEPLSRDGGQYVCPDCGNSYIGIGNHWSQSACRWPSVPADVWELLRGAALGDGTVRTDAKTPSMEIYTSRRPFLEWFGESMTWLSGQIAKHRSAERSAQQARQAGHNATESNYSAIYVLRTRAHPQFHELADWYVSTGTGRRQTVPPADLSMTPPLLGVWYACDGSLQYDSRYPSSRPYVRIGAQVAIDSLGANTVQHWFDPSPVTPTVDDNDGVVRFGVDDTPEILEWMRGPFPGFDEKWTVDGYDEYQIARPKKG